MLLVSITSYLIYHLKLSPIMYQYIQNAYAIIRLLIFRKCWELYQNQYFGYRWENYV